MTLPTDDEPAPDDAKGREALFAKACLTRGEKPVGPLAIYRRLVRSGLATTVFRLLPRSRARMNEAHDDAFDDGFVSFLDEAAPQTHFMRDVAGELVRWAEPRWQAAKVDQAWIELARYEAARFAVESAPDDDPKIELAEVSLSLPVVLTRALRIERLQHAVHELPENSDDRSLPRAAATTLLIYRDSENEVAAIELAPIFARLLEACASGAALKDALTSAASAEGVVLDDPLLVRVAQFLADLGERGILRGAAPPA